MTTPPTLELYVQEDRLRFRLNRDQIPPALLSFLHLHKSELTALLKPVRTEPAVARLLKTESFSNGNGVARHPVRSRAEEPSYQMIDNQADLGMVAAGVDDTGLVGLDLETTGLDPRK